MKLRSLPTIAAAVSILAAGIGALDAQPASLTVQVDKPAHAVAPNLFGVFFEDINLSTDGGIYPELVRNRSFEDSDQPESWTLVNSNNGGKEMAIDESQPLNPLNRHSLRVTLNGSTSLRNDGYWGMNFVKGQNYHFTVAARAGDHFAGPLTVALQTEDGRSLASASIPKLSGQWKTYTLELIPQASDSKGRLLLTATGTGTLWLDMVSLMPVATWKDHGLRPDLCNMLDNLQPSFMRFPGGCWVEGDDMAHMYHWKNTIGDISIRKPLYNIWGYSATHGLGFHEYLQLCEDLGAEPLFCINVGMSHHEVVPMDQMGQWVQDALDAIEYAKGPADSIWGSLRARNGHPAPFHLQYMEIGNENGGAPYRERWPLFYRAIKEKYPEMQLVADVWEGYPTDPRPDIVDEHYYSTPEFFMNQANRYDGYDRRGPKIFVGEYAVTQNCGKGNLRAAVGEAAFMTGMERNSDMVVMASYAPLFVNMNHRQWNPDLINFDSSRVYGLPSYYVQQMFSRNRGDTVLPVAAESPIVDGAAGGAVGIGTWRTEAEFKDLKVTRNGQTLFSSDFSKGMDGWKVLGGGDWKTADGVARQTSDKDFIRAVIGDKSWTDYTYTLKARKLRGDEGFLILFRANNDDDKCWWNLGGWGNTQHGIEMNGIITQAPGKIETGRWYDIRIETQGRRIKCYLDGKLIHDLEYPSMKSLFASATRDSKSGDVILKVVNVSASALETSVKLDGAKNPAGNARVTVLASANPTDENSLEEPTRVSPKTKTIPVSGPEFRHSFPGNSVTVLRVAAGN